MNNVTNNDPYGIVLSSLSYDNLITTNRIADNHDGIFLYASQDNNITENDLITNTNGIRLFNNSTANTIFHNNLIENAIEAYSDSVNVWDAGYPQGGNYWSDYTGMDLFSGFYQNETGSDGIGDAPYTIDSNNTDNYPLMIPWGSLLGDVNGDGYVGIDDIYLVASHFSREAGDPEYNRVYDLNGDGYIGVDDIFTVAKHFGQENP